MKIVKHIVFWGGLTTHCFEIAKAMKKIGWVVSVVADKKTCNREERVPQYQNEQIDVIFITSDYDIKTIANSYPSNVTIHINTALKDDKSLFHKALKALCKNHYHVFSLPQESFQFQGVKGFVNRIKWYYYLHFTYRKNISAFGLTGDNAFRCFKEMRVNVNKCFQFIYVTKQASLHTSFVKNKIIKFIYVGAIDKRKNIIPFVKFMMKFPNQDFVFDIYGSWSLDEELQMLVKDSKNVRYHGKQQYDVVRAKMEEADYLILPSLYDGWGAVANEGLQSGCKLILSKQCGSSIFTNRHDKLGYTFDADNMTTLDPILKEIFQQGPLEAEERTYIKTWADINISPMAVGQYLDGIINFYFNNGEKPTCPWM